MDAENRLLDDGGLLQDCPVDIGDRPATEMGRDTLEQLVDIVKRVAPDRIVQRAEIRRQGIQINSRVIRRGKTGIENNVVVDIVEVIEDLLLAPVTVHRFSKIESNSSTSISCSSACSPVRCCRCCYRLRLFENMIGQGGMGLVEDVEAQGEAQCRDGQPQPAETEIGSEV
jgi:hypothetical protein